MATEEQQFRFEALLAGLSLVEDDVRAPDVDDRHTLSTQIGRSTMKELIQAAERCATSPAVLVRAFVTAHLRSMQV
jgi:hypothetical protein